jgi:hypothetical protein
MFREVGEQRNSALLDHTPDVREVTFFRKVKILER